MIGMINIYKRNFFYLESCGQRKQILVIMKGYMIIFVAEKYGRITNEKFSSIKYFKIMYYRRSGIGINSKRKKYLPVTKEFVHAFLK